MLTSMTGGVGCPDENALVRFATGQLSGADLGSLEAHLDTCTSCRSLIAQLASGVTEVKATPSMPAVAAGEPQLVRHGRVGRYEVERLVGGGGMGVVYAARDKELNRVVAIKLLRTSALASVESRSRLLREAQTMAKLSHPNLVPIFELGRDQGDDFLAMELIDGPTLDIWLRERKRDWREVVKIFIEAGRGLEAAHQAGVVHRDFKPGNVLVGPDGRARVTDFGLARPRVPDLVPGVEAGSIELTREGSLLGTPAYMSPEQLEGQVADVRSDQFGFCVALAEALAGHRPFPGRTLEELRHRMRSGKPPDFELEPVRLKRALLKGMSISPDGRFGSMGELLEELAIILRPSRANARAVAAGMAFAVVLAAGAGVAWQQMNAPATAALEALEKAGAIDPTPKELRLTVGTEEPLTIPGVTQIAMGDLEIASAVTAGDRTVLVKALKPGVTSLFAWVKGDSTRLEWRVTVVAAPAPEAPEVLRLFRGDQKVLTIPGIQRVAVGDSAIADVKTLGDGQLLVVGAGVGRTTLMAWTSAVPPAGAERFAWEVVVVAPPATPSQPPDRTKLKLPIGTNHVLTIPGIQRVAVGDSEIADVKTIGNNQLLLIPVGGGTTTLLVWTSGNEGRLEWDVTVEDPGASVAVEEEGGPTKLKLRVGTQRVITVPGMLRLEVGDPKIADVKKIGNNQLLVIGVGAGTTALRVFTKTGRVEWQLKVEPPVVPSKQ
jgi:Flp pilus assembly secretin CpaC/predicted Ser/Thr protein kinase